MKRDPLDAVLRLRRLALDDAGREFADCLRRETEAEQATAAVEAAIVRETEAATSLSAGDAVVEAFGAWLRRAHRDLHAAQAAQERAEAETSRVRAILAAARAAVRAAEHMRSASAAARQADADRREQRTLDEIGPRQR